jgi:alpha-tubulin suppressor-like RCC1 family protein
MRRIITIGLCLVTVPLMSTLAASSATATTPGAWAWGADGRGQLGFTSGYYRTEVPVAVKGLGEPKAVAAGGSHSLALLSNGTVMAWGSNQFGQLGDGVTEPCCGHEMPVPTPVKGLAGVIAISAGYEHSLALLSTGRVMAWGDNYFGQLGNGSETGPEHCEGDPCSRLPVEVQGLGEVTAISAGWFSNLALLRNGTVVAWGDDRIGQLGNNTTVRQSDVPVAVSGLTGAASVAAGYDHSVALRVDGTVMTWGGNFDGQLGDGPSSGPEVCEFGPCSKVPVAVKGLSGVTAISAGDSFSLALLTVGNVLAWGNDYTGELGNGVTGADSDVPVAVKELSGVTAISAGDTHSLALLNSGTVMAWGDGYNGELGNPVEYLSDVPVPVTNLTGVTDVSAGDSFSLAIAAPGDQPITAGGATVGSTEEGNFSGPVATFNDPDTVASTGEYSAKIKWGDGGSSTGTIGGSGGRFVVSGEHIYADEGSYVVNVRITDTDTASNTAITVSTANVADAEHCGGRDLGDRSREVERQHRGGCEPN